MTNNKNLLICLPVILISMLLMKPFFAASEEIRLTSGEWAPYLSEHLPHFGFASHVVKEAFATQGVSVVYGFFPWKRSYKLAKEGQWHGTVVWVHTPERARAFLYSHVVVRDTELLFHLKSIHLEWERVEDLKGMVIGGTLHTAYPFFEGAAQKGLLTIERAGTYENLYHRLLRKRIDAIPQVAAVGHYLIRTRLKPEEQEKITFSPTVVEKRQYCLILSKKRKENLRFLKMFNTGLSGLIKSGRYQEMLSALEKGKYDEK